MDDGRNSGRTIHDVKNFSMLDIVDAMEVEFVADQFGKVWLNVDGRCVARIGRVDIVATDDPERGRHRACGPA